MQAVSEHPDGYVRYRALVLLTGFNDPRARDVMRESLASPNDRLANRRLQLLRAQSRSARSCPSCWRLSTRSRRNSSGPRSSARWRRRRRLRSRRCQRAQVLVREAGRGRGLLPQRGDRGAWRFQGAVRVRDADGDRQARWPAAGRRGDRAREDWRQACARTCWQSCSGRRRRRRSRMSRRRICLLGRQLRDAPRPFWSRR